MVRPSVEKTSLHTNNRKAKKTKKPNQKLNPQLSNVYSIFQPQNVWLTATTKNEQKPRKLRTKVEWRAAWDEETILKATQELRRVTTQRINGQTIIQVYNNRESNWEGSHGIILHRG